MWNFFVSNSNFTGHHVPMQLLCHKQTLKWIKNNFIDFSFFFLHEAVLIIRYYLFLPQLQFCVAIVSMINIRPIWFIQFLRTWTFFRILLHDLHSFMIQFLRVTVLCSFRQSCFVKVLVFFCRQSQQNNISLL